MLFRSSDGTRFGTQFVKSLTISSSFVIKGSEFYFREDIGATENYLWKSDGTTNGTRRVPTFQPGQTPGSVVENKLYSSIPSLNSAGGVYILTTNPTPAPIINSAYDSVNPNTEVSLTSKNCMNQTYWSYRNITTTGILGSYTPFQESSIFDTPPNTTVYNVMCRDKVCTSPVSSKTITIFSCPPTLSLASTTDDISSGTITKSVNATNGNITATNKITGTAKVTYQAKSIQLNAGFKADNGTIFKAEIGGCN